MKISNEFTKPVQQGETQSAAKAAPATRAAATGKAVAASDSVRISAATRELNVGGSEAPFDAKRVDEIKAAIAAGTFKVNAGVVADKLVDSVSQLLADKAQ